MTVADYTRVAFWMGAHLGDGPRPMGRLISIEECAAYIGRTPKAVQRLVDKGEIPHTKIGRRLQFDRERIERWVERHAKFVRRGVTR